MPPESCQLDVRHAVPLFTSQEISIWDSLYEKYICPGNALQFVDTDVILLFDAHGDMNTWETTTTGLLGGMPYAVALGWDLADWRLAAGLEPAVRPEAAALIGTSDLDPAEVEALQRHPILHMDAQNLMQPKVAERVQAALSPRAAEANGWYVHLDLDVAGPEELPGG